MNRRRTQVFLVAVGWLGMIGSVFGYYMLPSLAELAQKADLVCLGQVIQTTEIETRGDRRFLSAEFLPHQIFQGDLAAGGPIEIVSMMNTPMAEVEDPIPAFPEKGSHALVFLRRQGNVFTPVCPRSSLFTVGKNDQLEPSALFSLAQVKVFFADKPDKKNQ